MEMGGSMHVPWTCAGWEVGAGARGKTSQISDFGFTFAFSSTFVIGPTCSPWRLRETHPTKVEVELKVNPKSEIWKVSVSGGAGDSDDSHACSLCSPRGVGMSSAPMRRLGAEGEGWRCCRWGVGCVGTRDVGVSEVGLCDVETVFDCSLEEFAESDL